MRAGPRIAMLAALVVLAAGTAEAKKFRYSGGPPVPGDTTYATAVTEGEPVVRSRGPKVPPTNFEVVSAVSDVAFDRAMRECPVDSGGRVLLAPAESHPLNFMVEHAILQHLARRGIGRSLCR